MSLDSTLAVWLHNAGALAMWIPVLIVIGMGLLAYHRFGSATTFSLHTMRPSVRLDNIIFWSVLTFAFGGCETALFMAEEIKNARRTIPLALFFGGLTVAFCYIVGTVCVLLALPASEVSPLQGLVQAIAKTTDRVGLPFFLPVAALLIALSNIGASALILPPSHDCRLWRGLIAIYLRRSERCIDGGVRRGSHS